jgi:AcrR family transcriptional regulator
MGKIDVYAQVRLLSFDFAGVLSMSGKLLLEEMKRCVAQWEEQQDQRAIFLSCYALMTENMLEAIEAGEFRDPGWVAALLEHFAEYYFHALTAYEQDPRTTPRVWNYAFTAANHPETNVLAKLILGVNAHINYDLVFAVADMLESEWADLSAEQRGLRHQDHSHVNAIIARTIESVQDQVVERYDSRYALVDELMGPLDEWATAKLIAEWREHVWQSATRWLAAKDETERQAVKAHVENESVRIANTLLGKGNLTDWVATLRDSI